MCGIVALVSSRPRADLGQIAARMTQAVAHRGPDGSGLALFDRRTGGGLAPIGAGEAARVALGHRRLSILDLTEAGTEPMPWPTRDGPLWIVFNGEVYNFVELREQLRREGHRFHSRTDTEVILAAYAEWGPACVERMNGMWAFALLDTRSGKLIVSRDRVGIKPLYLWRGPGVVALVSELKQLRDLPDLPLRPDPGTVADYLLTGYERTQRTFFEGVVPVPAGTSLAVDLETLSVSPFAPYWRPERILVDSAWDPEAAARAFDTELARACRWQLRSDVSVGFTVSGGLDSSAVVQSSMSASPDLSLAEGTGGPPRNAFSAVFPGTPLDEGPYARRVAEAVGIAWNPVEPTARGFLDDLDEFVWHHDEPVGGLSMYAGYCVARLMRRTGVPVSLNGQGGDEVFGGYWQSYMAYLVRLARGGQLLRLGGHTLGSLVGGNPMLLAQFRTMLRRYRQRRSPPLALAPELVPAATDARSQLHAVLSLPEQERRLFEIRELHLPRLLKWDDRNFMAFGVEGRYPFLDHGVIELCLSLPPGALYRRGWTKMPLRRAFAGRLPDEIVWRRAKLGFVTPQTAWLKDALRPTVEALLADRDAPVWSYADRASADRLASAAFAPETAADEPAQGVLRVLYLDRWLRRFWP